MSSHTKMIGDIGVSAVITEFLKHGVKVLLPYDDNSSYDIVININNTFYKIQVKTTEKIMFHEYMIFSTNITNPYVKSTKKYTKEEVDYFVLYCIENEWMGMFECTGNEARETIIRVKETKNNQDNKSKFSCDYEFHKQMKDIFNMDYIKNTITHNENKQKSKRNRKTKLCPVCNKNYIKNESKTCRECYLKIINNTKS